jgi:hypothetical protein
MGSGHSGLLLSAMVLMVLSTLFQIPSLLVSLGYLCPFLRRTLHRDFLDCLRHRLGFLACLRVVGVGMLMLVLVLLGMIRPSFPSIYARQYLSFPGLVGGS